MNSPWPIVRLGNYLEFLTSGSRGWSEYVRDSGSLFIRIQNVGRNELLLNDIAYVQPPSGAETERTLVRPGDVLLSITADLGRTAVVPDGLGAAHINQHLAILRIRDFDPHFVSAFIGLGPGRLQLFRLDKGGVKSGLNFDDIRSLNLPLPPLVEQRRIADILDKADAIRRKRKEAIALTEELLRSAFLEMFGDPVTNPKGLPKDTIGNLISLKSGDFLPAKEMEMNGPYPVYGGNGINGHHSKFMFDSPVITIGRVGVYCGVVHLTKPNSWVTDNALYVSRYSDSLNMTYLEHALRMANLNQYASQAAQPLISGGRVNPVEILVPRLVVQEKFERMVDVQGRIAAKNAAAFEDADLLFGSLVHRAFSGSLSS